MWLETCGRERTIMMRQIIHIVFCGFLSVVTLQAQPASVLEDSVFLAKAERGLKHLYNMEYDAAQATFDQLQAQRPGHPVGPFLDALNVWWKILVDLQNEAYDKSFFRAMDETVKRADRLLKQDPQNIDALFFKGLALSFKSRLHANRSHWIRSAKDGKAALDFVIRLAETDAENDDFYFGWGVYDYYADVMAERRKIVKFFSWFFPNGDKERGLNELHRTFRNGRFLRAEAAYFLFQIYYFYERDFAKSVEYITWLRVTYPRNAYFHTLEGRMYARWGRWDRVSSIFKDILARYQAGQTGYSDGLAEQALYYLARTEMGYGRYDATIPYLKHLEELSARLDKDTPYRVLGRLRQGMVLDVLGHRSGAVMRYNQVLNMKDWSGSRDRAKRYLEHPYGQPRR